VRIETLADGQVSEIHIGLKGTMAALFLKDQAKETRRGQIGRVKVGRIPGGKSYGYDVVLSGGERGERSINETEATIVRRIYYDYAAGKSPLAHRLRTEPRGYSWAEWRPLECFGLAGLPQAA
jgi:site-specific DNA recombinase